MTERYKVVEGSQSIHCCFDYTIVDTTKPEMIGGTQYRDDNDELQWVEICECFDEKSANLICKALNNYDTVATG